MKYFTEEYCFSQLEDEKIEENYEKYGCYIDSVYAELPFVLKLLTKNIQLHDGIITKMSYSSSTHQLTLEGVFGDLEVGYYELILHYSNVHLGKDVLNSFRKGQLLEILSDEVEVIEKGYLHKIFFSNKTELDIVFSDLSMNVTDCDANKYKKTECVLHTI